MGLIDRVGKGKIKPAEKKVGGVEYKTNLDRIYFEVKRAKDLSLLALSRKLNIEKNRVEEFAEILDSQGLLDLYYTGFGVVRLKAKEVKKKVTLKKGNRVRNLLFFSVTLLIILIGFIVYIKFLR